MLFILNKSHKVVGSLNSSGDLSKITTYFDDSYVQDLGTGAETFQFSTLADNEESQHLVVGNFIAFKEEDEFKLFNIIQIEETHEDSFIKTVYCEMASIELINEIIRPMKVLNSSLRKFLNSILAETDWQLGKMDAGFTQVYDFEISDYTSVYSLIQEYAVGVFGAEISYRVEIEHGEIVGKYIDCYAERGNSNGFRFAYGSNLTSVVRTVDTSELATALIGVGNNGLTFKNVDVADKPLGQDFIASETAYKQWNVNGSHIMGVHNADTDSEHELLRLTRIALVERSQPKIKYEMKVEILGKKVGIGDTVNVVDHEFNPPIYLSARVNQITKSKTNPYNDEVVLANFKEINSNITNEMRQLASQLEGYVNSQFPIGGDKIQDGAIDGNKVSKEYHTQVVADAVYASLIEVGELVATKVDVEELNAVYASIEDLNVKKATIEELYTQKAEIDELIAKKADIESLKAITANIETLYTEKANVTDLNALNATITNLKTEKADIKDLTAQKAEIEELIAKKASIDSLDALEIKVNDLNANKANITDLNAVNATIGSLQANKADVVELDAVKGNIETLYSNVAEINTLVNGNLTSDNIHSLILTSDKVTVEDAFIKNAMIDEIDAKKIKSGSIDTELVTISSPTGGIVISDNTQQFKDSNGKVRVQIGEDKNGEFNFSIYDETGVGVLIDHTGVKENALGDDIIKENMISSDAVGEKQIDYDSFTTGFNNETNTNTLNATKVKLDSTNQTLEVGFNSLKTQADDTKSKTESNTTKLEVQQGQIQTLINDTTIEKDGESIKIKDAYSEVVQTVDAFGVTMGEHSTKITEIGGKVDDALTKATDAENTANGISGRVTEVESKQSTLKQDLDGFKTSVSKDYSTKTELKATNDKVGTLEGTINSTSSKVASIETNLEGITQRVSSTESTTTTLTEKVSTAQSTADSAIKEISSTNSKVSNIETNLNGITSRVSSVENTTKSIDGKVTDLTSRMSSAEQKITDKAIISTVTSTIEQKVDEGVNNIQIGGKNLLEGSNTNDYIKTIDETLGTYNQFWQIDITHVDSKIEVGDVITISFDVQMTTGTVLRVYDTNSYIGKRFGTKQWNNIGNKKVRLAWTTTVLDETKEGSTTHILGFYNNNNGDKFTIENIQIEKGNKATDWNLAKEDIENSISETERVLNDNIDNAIGNAIEDIYINVGENYTSKDDFKALNESVTSKFEQTSKDITASFESSKTYTDTVDGKLEEFKETIGTHIRFSSNGIDLGKTNSPFTATLDNTQLAFKQNGDTVAYISNNKMYITQAEIKDTLRIGKTTTGFFTWEQGSNGNLSLKWSDK